MSNVVRSQNGVPIRLPDERWSHIVEEHSELTGLRLEVLETVAEPDTILEGKHGEKLAVRSLETGRWLVVVYREWETDGFVITAFITTRPGFMERRKRVWP